VASYLQKHPEYSDLKIQWFKNTVT
jgi:hypothetical protein